jgi:Kef-type K+ transport system membrane component KefB
MHLGPTLPHSCALSSAWESIEVNTLLYLGISIAAGYLLGELVSHVGLPRVSGYILAGLALNPKITGIVPLSFVNGVDPVINLSLAVLTFAVGGTLALAPLRELGKKIILLALGEAELSALLVILGSIAVFPFILRDFGSFKTQLVPFALMLGALASPTDPSATLAVIHQYKARGVVSFSIMASAALDDALGILNFSVAIVVASILITHASKGFGAVLEPVLAILGAVALGIASGALFHWVPRWFRSQSDGLLLVVLFGLLASCYGVATVFNLDQLLATMSMGIVVVNVGADRTKVFRLLEEYIEPLVFVVFFTVSGMLLDVQVLFHYFPVVLLFVVFRTAGKLGGAYVGALVGRSAPVVRRYAGWGLIPQGGIVIGLALLFQQDPAFSTISNILLSVIIGSTVIHELLGPLTAKVAIVKSGEIGKASS